MEFKLEQYLDGIYSGDKRMIGKAITLVESKKPTHRKLADELLRNIMPRTGKSVRIGITGIPGAGKSTFIESYGKILVQKGHRVAVLAIDPSSSLNKGSILGDKTRMEELAKMDKVFIRPSPTSGFLGGVANATFETMLICEAAGYDYILIETVGVGQSEVLVADITDAFVFLKITGGGDELQGIKRGIMEMVDLVFINKVDEQNRTLAKNTKIELMRALHFLSPKEAGWKVPVLLGSALQNEGLAEVYEKLSELVALKKSSGRFDSVRKEQAQKRFEYWVQAYILQQISENHHVETQYSLHKKNASELTSNPSTEAQLFVLKLFEK